jgi:hypothetical protein
MRALHGSAAGAQILIATLEKISAAINTRSRQAAFLSRRLTFRS